MAQSQWGAAIDRLYESGDLDPVKYNNFRVNAKTSEDSRKFWEQIAADPESYTPKIKPSAAQLKARQQQKQETQTGQDLLDVLSGQLGQQAGGVNQAAGQAVNMLPFGDVGTPPQFTPQQMLPQQQQGLLGLLQADPRSATFETMQESFPQRFGAPEDPLERAQAEYKTKWLEQQVKGEERRGKELELKQEREKRLFTTSERQHIIKLEELGIKKDRLSLDNQKYILELTKLDKANDYQSIKAINDIAKLIAPGQEITDEIFAQAIEKLKSFNPRFNELHKRAVKKQKGFFGKKYPTLKRPEEIIEDQDPGGLFK